MLDKSGGGYAGIRKQIKTLSLCLCLFKADIDFFFHDILLTVVTFDPFQELIDARAITTATTDDASSSSQLDSIGAAQSLASPAA